MQDRRSFTKYVHEYETRDGSQRFAVGEWSDRNAQYTRPFDATEYRLTGCSAELSRTPSGLQSFRTRRQALRRARYLYYERDKAYIDWQAELDDWLSTPAGRAHMAEYEAYE